MRLTSFTLKNFRGYRESVTIKIDNLTALVGKNDVGKSTILEAMDLFFNEGSNIIKKDSDDLNVNAKESGENEFVLTATFSELPVNITIDTSYSTSFGDEYLLNRNGELEVEKHFSHGKTIKVYIKANHPTNMNCCDLLQKKNSELKTIIRDNDIVCDNLAINTIMRRAIWNYYENDGLNFADVNIEVEKEDAKEIWGKIKSLLPLYFLFQSDRKNSDGDSEIQDPLQQSVRIFLENSEIQNELIKISQKVQEQLQNVANRTLEKLREMDSSVADSLCPHIPNDSELKWSDVFKKVSISGEEGIPMNKRGSGVKRLILFNFFRAEVENKMLESNDSRGVIYGIEEPETSQHSINQEKLIDVLIGLSNIVNKQVVITTHSVFVVKSLKFDNIRLIVDETEGHKAIKDVLPNLLLYPSLDEIIYLAYGGEVSAAYHIELYGFLQQLTGKEKIKDADQYIFDYLQNKENRDSYLRDSSYKRTCYKTLPTYIRNAIDHPDNGNGYSHEEMKLSAELLRKMCSDLKENIE